MNRALTLVAALLLSIGPAGAQEGRKLMNAELKEIAAGTDGILFTGGYSISHGSSYHMSWFSEGVRKGTRKHYWTNGPQHMVVRGDWRIEGDTICVKNEYDVSEACDEWRKNGDRIETWNRGVKNGYFFVLPKASSQ
jgi:hypothetical protein